MNTMESPHASDMTQVRYRGGQRAWNRGWHHNHAGAFGLPFAAAAGAGAVAGSIVGGTVGALTGYPYGAYASDPYGAYAYQGYGRTDPYVSGGVHTSTGHPIYNSQGVVIDQWGRPGQAF
jgi:hypothetical protein